MSSENSIVPYVSVDGYNVPGLGSINTGQDQQSKIIPDPATNTLALSVNQVKQSLGITRLEAGTDSKWSQIIGGLIVQGDYIADVPLDSTQVVPFHAPFTKKVLGVFVTPVFTGPSGANNDASGGVVKGSVTLTQFELINDGALKDFYWFAIGV